MVLSYIPGWNFGSVDNIGIGNNEGGVRTLIDWPRIPLDEASATGPAIPDRSLCAADNLAPARRTDPRLRDPGGLVRDDVVDDPAPVRIGAGGHLRFRARRRLDALRYHTASPPPRSDGRRGTGSFSGSRPRTSRQVRETFSDYKLVSREGDGQWANRRPVLLVVKAAKAVTTLTD